MRSVSMLAVFLALGATHNGAVARPPDDSLDARAFPRGPTADSPAGRPWTWPTRDRFDAAWGEFDAAVGLVLVQGSIRGSDGLWQVEQSPLGWIGRPLLPDHGNSWVADRAPVAGTIAVVTDGLLLVDAVSAPLPASGEARAARAYLHALTATKQPLYVPGPGDAAQAPDASELRERFRSLARSDGAAALALAPELLEHPSPASDWTWGALAALAQEHGNIEIELAARARFQPRGFCSMDRSPENAHRAYADACQRAGDTACFARLVLLAMDYWAAPRLAWSSYGEASSPTGVELLKPPGVDLQRFLLGTLFAWDREPAGIPTVSMDRLARAIQEAGIEEGTMAALVALTQDESLDDSNRLRAVMLLAHLQDDLLGPAADLPHYFSELRLPTAAPIWVAGLTRMLEQR